jgi:hypothetical protein
VALYFIEVKALHKGRGLHHIYCSLRGVFDSYSPPRLCPGHTQDTNGHWIVAGGMPAAFLFFPLFIQS